MTENKILLHFALMHKIDTLCASFSEAQKYVTIKTLSLLAYEYAEKMLDSLPASFSYNELLNKERNDPELCRLNYLIYVISGDPYYYSIFESLAEGIGIGDGMFTKQDVLEEMSETKKWWNTLSPDQMGFDLVADPLK